MSRRREVDWNEYHLDARSPEAKGRLGITVRVIGNESKTLARVEFAAGVEERYQGLGFIVERKWLTK